MKPHTLLAAISLLLGAVFASMAVAQEILPFPPAPQLAQNGIPTKISQHLTALEELGGLDALGGPKTDNMFHAG